MNHRYPTETLDADYDDGTMPDNVDTLAESVVGHRIVAAEQRSDIPKRDGSYRWRSDGLLLTLDNGQRVTVANTDDCCAYTELEEFLLHPERVDHIITGVGTTDGYTRWHIYADAGDVLELTVGWSSGNPFYYGYGFAIDVLPAETEEVLMSDTRNHTTRDQLAEWFCERDDDCGEAAGWAASCDHGFGYEKADALLASDAIAAVRAAAVAETEAKHRDLVSRLGFGDNITEPMADNDTIVKWFDQMSRDANEWQESQIWRNDCYAKGHPDDDDCFECDPQFAPQRAVAETTAAIEALLRQVEDDARENQHLARLSTREVRAALSGGRTALNTALAQARADAWDEGYDEGMADNLVTNPYRADTGADQ